MSDQGDSRVPAVAGAGADAPSIAESLGGRLGIVESALPAIAFVAAYTATGQDARLSATIALAIGVALALARLARRQTVRYALSGLAGVALAAFIVSRTGRAEDFFLPGLLMNAGYALAYTVSIVVGWPLLGVFVGAITGQGMSWRDDPAQVRAYTRASWIWVVMFLLRLAVQLPLYLAGAVVALGVARVAMGAPLFAIAAWLSWLLLRPPPEVRDDAARER
ncbi:MAG TPA: DUF3159 domain-containing protein [Thermoleophilaceae bacterium]|nr:DUF3159 domain-containing protein [Thermoleophilaceae bacterium]